MKLVLGYGNWLRTDDGLGPWLASLPRSGWTPVAAHQLLPEHAEMIHRAERVVFVDAEIGTQPGAVYAETIAPCEETDHTHALGAFTHNATPRLLLGVARDLYGACPPALLISVGGADFAHGDGFSAEIVACLAEITTQVDDLIEQFGNQPSGSEDEPHA
jgi:hydrogenase maturation protease